MLLTILRSHARTLTALGLVLGAPSSLGAHDLWLEPATFLPQPGQIVALRLRVGQDFLGDPLPRDARLVREFVVEDSEGRKPVIGRDGSDPAGFIRASDPGLLVVGYHSTPSVVELTPDKFAQYIEEEGLDEVAARRRAEGSSQRGGRDAYTRCAKSLVLLGPPSASQTDRPLGMTLELLAESNPYLLKDGDTLPLRLLYRQAPLKGTLVVAINKRHPMQKLTARTDAHGRVRLPLTRGGAWLIKAVHMVPAAPGAGAEWDSYWASLTFGS